MKKIFSLILVLMICFINVSIISGCSRAYVMYYRAPSPEEKAVLTKCMHTLQTGSGSLRTEWRALGVCLNNETPKVEWKCGVLKGVPTCPEAKELLEKEGYNLYDCFTDRSVFHIFDTRSSTDSSQDLLRPYRRCY